MRLLAGVLLLSAMPWLVLFPSFRRWCFGAGGGLRQGDKP